MQSVFFMYAYVINIFFCKLYEVLLTPTRRQYGLVYSYTDQSSRMYTDWANPGARNSKTSTVSIDGGNARAGALEYHMLIDFFKNN